jgi:hypothetical protein
MPNLRIDAEDFNDPWHAQSNTKGKGRASQHYDSQASVNWNQAQDADSEHNPYHYSGGVDDDAYYVSDNRADDLPFGSPSSACDSQGQHVLPQPVQKPTSGLHSRYPSVAPTVMSLGFQVRKLVS